MTIAQDALRLLLVSLSLSGMAYSADLQGSKDPFSIQISSPQVILEVGSEVRVRVIVINTSNVATSIGTVISANALCAGFQVHAYDAQNRHLKMTPMAWSFSGKKVLADDKNDYTGKAYKQDSFCTNNGDGGLPLNPGGKLTYWFNLLDAYNLTPGKYTISVSIQDWKSKVVVTSNKIEITVVGKGELQPEQKAAPPR